MFSLSFLCLCPLSLTLKLNFNIIILSYMYLLFRCFTCVSWSVCGVIALWLACVVLQHHGECVRRYSVLVSVSGVLAFWLACVALQCCYQHGGVHRNVWRAVLCLRELSCQAVFRTSVCVRQCMCIRCANVLLGLCSLLLAIALFWVQVHFPLIPSHPPCVRDPISGFLLLFFFMGFTCHCCYY